MMEDRFGVAFTSLDRVKTSAGSEFMKEFESCKRNFHPDSARRVWRLPLKMSRLNKKNRALAGWYDFEESKVKLNL